MKLEWFENADNMVYGNLDKLTDTLVRQTGQSQWRSQIEDFKENPTKDGLSLKLGEMTALFLFIPNLVFEKKLKLGNHVWVYFSETQECYCLQ